MDEERITELESRLAFLEQSLQEVNDVVAAQQAILERFEMAFEQLRAPGEGLSPQSAAGRAEHRPPESR